MLPTTSKVCLFAYLQLADYHADWQHCLQDVFNHVANYAHFVAKFLFLNACPYFDEYLRTTQVLDSSKCFMT